MTKWIWTIGPALILSGVICLAVSANGPWGFSLNGKLCWIPPFVGIMALLMGITLLGLVGSQIYRKLFKRLKRCPNCGAEVLEDWSICYRCGTVHGRNYKKNTNI